MANGDHQLGARTGMVAWRNSPILNGVAMVDG